MTAFKGLYNPYELKWGAELSFPSSKALPEYGNRIYNRYPARSIFLVPRAVLSLEKGKNLSVLDPFMGSGTTGVETVLSGNHALGAEMDPFARLISSVSTTVFSKRDCKKIDETYQSIINSWSDFSPADTPDLKGIERWFSDGNLEKLLRLKHAILELSDEKYRPFFLVTFADCVKPVSLMERQSLKPYISKKYKKKTKSVEDSFLSSFDAHYEAIVQMSAACKKASSGITWVGNDASDFETKKESVDVAITSPPYINALDYTRCIKIESAMCGTLSNSEISHLHKSQIGHEARRNQQIDRKVDNAFSDYYMKISSVDCMRAETARAYFNDIYKNLICVRKVLKDGGVYHMIIGDNNIRKIAIPSHEIIAHLGEEAGFKWIGYYKYRIKDHRMSIPRPSAEEKIEYEHVIMLQR